MTNSTPWVRVSSPLAKMLMPSWVSAATVAAPAKASSAACTAAELTPVGLPRP